MDNHNRDDLPCAARMLLGVAQVVAAMDSLMPAEPHCPDRGEFCPGPSVNVGMASASAAVQQPVAVASIHAAAFVAATPAVDVPVHSPVLFAIMVFYCFAYNRLFFTVERIGTNLMVDWSV